MAASGSRYLPPERTARAGTWNVERVLEALRDWQREFGQAPRVYEWSVAGARAAGREDGLVRRWAAEHPRWPSSHTVWRYFGSWTAALETAGLIDERNGPWELPLGERVESARRMAARGISRAQIAAELGVKPGTVMTYLKASPCPRCGAPVVNASAAHCVACAAALSHLPSFTPEQVVEAVQAWARGQSGRPRATDWMATSDERRRWAREYPRWPSVGQAADAFGSWNAALRAAGLEVVDANNRPAMDASRRAGAPEARGWTVEAILEVVSAWVVRHGRAPRSEELRAPLPSAGAIVKHFGSQGALREALGLPASTYEWSRELIVEAMQWFAEEHARPPTVADWKAAAPTYPAPETVGRRFGSWAEALRAAGLAVARSDWTRDAALEAIGAHLRRHGRVPTATEWRRRDPCERRPAAHNLAALFGSFDDALRAAGHEVEHWNRESIIEALRELAVELGRVPRLSDLQPKRPGRPGADRMRSQFGSFGQALVAAGLTTGGSRWTNETVLAAIRAWVAGHGRPPRYEEWARAGEGYPSASVLERRFGRFSDALVAAGVAERAPVWDRDRILEALREWAREHGSPPTAGQWRGRDRTGRRPECQRVTRIFGSWDAALAAAGLHARPKRWSDEQILAAIRAHAAEHGRAPRSTEWPTATDAHPAAATVANHFGSWTRALAAAGLNAARRPRWEPDDIIAALRAWTTAHGRPPTRSDWARRDPAGAYPGASTVNQRLGSWERALECAGVT